MRLAVVSANGLIERLRSGIALHNYVVEIVLLTCAIAFWDQLTHFLKWPGKVGELCVSSRKTLASKKESQILVFYGLVC